MSIDAPLRAALSTWTLTGDGRSGQRAVRQLRDGAVVDVAITPLDGRGWKVPRGHHRAGAAAAHQMCRGATTRSCSSGSCCQSSICADAPTDLATREDDAHRATSSPALQDDERPTCWRNAEQTDRLLAASAGAQRDVVEEMSPRRGPAGEMGRAAGGR